MHKIPFQSPNHTKVQTIPPTTHPRAAVIPVNTPRDTVPGIPVFVVCPEPPPVVLPPELEFDLAPAPGTNTGGGLGVKTAGLGIHDDAAEDARTPAFAFALMVAFPENEHATSTRRLSS
jgi:hypothetical protein